MTFDDALELVKQEHTRIRAIHGDSNKKLRAIDWVTLFAQRIGHLSAAASSANTGWFMEELAKLAATALAGLENQPDVGVSLGAEGIAEISGADTPYPKITGKLIEVPPEAVRIATGVEGKVYVGQNAVWVARKEAIQKG